MNNQVTDYRNALWYPSSSFDARKEPIKYVVLHGTWVEDSEVALNDFLCNPNIDVSCHYLVDRDGQVFQLVKEEQRAWHAGKSTWRADASLNHSSIGIEMQNKGEDSGEPYTEAQYESLSLLLKGIMLRHKITPENVLAHSDIATDRKDDPGTHFDWLYLEKQGLAQPWTAKSGDAIEVMRDYGWHGTDEDIVKAFQRRYLPSALSGKLCDETMNRICGK